MALLDKRLTDRGNTMDDSDISPMLRDLPVGSYLETDEMTFVVGPKSITVIPEDPYSERYEVSRR
ncbi:hypothetical protein GCM10027402_25420 [Arthrobacter monumenti]